MTQWTDIGSGVRIAWLYDYDDETVLALIEEHDPGVSGCNADPSIEHSGTAWIEPTHQASRPHWTVEAGTAGDATNLTLTPSILHHSCGFHGWVRDGRWVPA